MWWKHSSTQDAVKNDERAVGGMQKVLTVPRRFGSVLRSAR